MEAGHFPPEMLSSQMAMFQAQQGMTAPQGANHAMAYGMGHMGDVQGQAACHMAQQPGYMGHMGVQMAPDGTPVVMPYAMDGQQSAQHAQAQQMMYQQHCGGGGQCGNGGQCGGCQGCQGAGCQQGCQGAACQGAACQGAACQQGCQGHNACSGCNAACPGAACSGCAGCPGNCGGYVVQMPGGIPTGMMGMMPGQMPMGQQQPGQQHPGMQFVMVPGQGGPGQMQHAMQGMPGQMPGQMQQMQGVQGGVPQQMAGAPGHMEGHPMGQAQPGAPCVIGGDHGKGPCQGPSATDAGDGKGGRVAAGHGRNTQPKQGANWQQGAGRGAGRSTDARPFEPSHQEQAPAVPGEQGKGAAANQTSAAQDGNKGNKLRNPKNPWADIQDSDRLDQEMHQLWDINLRPGQVSTDTNQKAGGFTKGKGKKDGGKDGGRTNNDDNSGGGKGGKDAPQQKWVEKMDPMAKGQNRGHVRDQWQPKDVLKQQVMQPVPMSPGGKSAGKGGYQQPGGCGGPMLAQSPGPKKNKKGTGRDHEMDDWLSARFAGQVPATPTGSTSLGMDDSMWAEEEDNDSRQKRKGGGKGGAGKGHNGKNKGGNGKGKAKGRGGGGNWQRTNA